MFPRNNWVIRLLAGALNGLDRKNTLELTEFSASAGRHMTPNFLTFYEGTCSGSPVDMFVTTGVFFCVCKKWLLV